MSSRNTHNVLRYDGTKGDFLEVFASGGGLETPRSLARRRRQDDPRGLLLRWIRLKPSDCAHWVASGTWTTRPPTGNDAVISPLACSGGGPARAGGFITGSVLPVDAGFGVERT